MDYETMDVHEVLGRLHDELLAEGWSYDGATTYIDGLAHVRGQVERESAIMAAMHDLGLLWIVQTQESVAAHVMVTTFERVAVLA